MKFLGLWMLCLVIGKDRVLGNAGQCQGQAKCDPTPQFGGALKPLSSCSADGATLTAAVAANSSACLHCLDGFKIRNQGGLKDSIEVQCGNDGKWKIPAHCENQIACTRPAASGRSNTYSRIKENFDAMLQMEFECTRDDFIMHGGPVVKCLAGKWDVDPLPVCRHKSSCFLAIEHGQITTSPGSVDTHGPWARNRDSGTVTCDQGHDSITDDDTLTCNWGKWEPAPHCVEPGLIGKCVTPPLRNGNVTLTTKKTIPGTVATHICASGYTLEGDVNRTCLRHGGWNGKEATCVLKATCDKPQTIAHAWDPPDKAYYHNEKYRYICRSGYERRGGSYYQCDANSNRWEPLSFDTRRMRCEPVNCGRPSDIQNAVPHLGDGRSTSFGAEVRYQCKTGYEQTRGISMSRICHANGRWTVIDLQCDIVDCYDPGHIYNGHLQAGNTTYPSQRQFGCNDFTTMEPVYASARAFIICQKDGQWSKSLPKCWGKCRVPSVANGYYRTTWGGSFYSDALEHGDEVKLHCYGDYTTDIRYPWSSTKTLKCDNGTLTQGSCTEKPCDELSKSDENLSNVIYSTDVIDFWTSKYYTHGTTADITCLDTHATANRGNTLQLTCNKRSWNKRTPICQPKECIIPTSASSDLRLYQTDMYGRATYHFRELYLTHDTVLYIACSASKTVFNSTMKRSPLTTKCTFGKWENPTVFDDTCVPDPCSKLSERRLDFVRYSKPIVSLRRTDYVRHGTNVSFTCKPRYELSEHKPSGWVECDTGKYQPGNVPQPEVCKEKACIIPVSASSDLRLYTTDWHGRATYRSRGDYLMHDTVLSIDCSASKTVFDSNKNRIPLTTRCTFGKWENKAAFDEICVPEGCRVPDHTDRTLVIQLNDGNTLSHPFDQYFSDGYLIYVACEDGFVLNSTNTNPGSDTRCNLGVWTDPEAFNGTCIEVSVCVDRDSGCSRWKHLCHSREYLRTTLCKESCGLCP